MDSGDPQPRARRLRSDRARQVADVLRRQITEGSAGHLLPDETALRKEFGVSRNAVREALDVLRQEGLVSRLPGIGTVAATAKLPLDVEHVRGLGESLSAFGNVTNEVRTAELVTPPRAVATALELDRDAPVVYIERLRKLDDEAVALDLTYLPAPVGEPLLTADLATRDLFTLIEATSGRRLGRAEIGVEAVAADARTAALLSVPTGSAMLVMHRLTRFADGTTADLEYLTLRGDRMMVRVNPEDLRDRQ